MNCSTTSPHNGVFIASEIWDAVCCSPDIFAMSKSSPFISAGLSGRHDVVIFTAVGARVRQLLRVLLPQPRPTEVWLWVVAGDCSVLDIDVRDEGSGDHRARREGEWPLAQST